MRFALTTPRIVLALCLVSAFGLHGCVIPLPGGNDEDAVTEAQLLTIEQGLTSRERVIAVLGDPDIIWLTERVHIYRQGAAVQLLWIIPGGYTAGVFSSELGDDVVIIQYDEDDLVVRLEQRSGTVDADFLLEWVKEKPSQ